MCHTCPVSAFGGQEAIQAIGKQHRCDCAGKGSTDNQDFGESVVAQPMTEQSGVTAPIWIYA